MQNELAKLSIRDAAKKLQAKEISSVELTRACLNNIEKRNASLNAYLEVFDDAEAQAEAADIRRAGADRSEAHPLLGIPLALKDNILIEGRRATAASKILENYVAAYDSTVAKKLKDAGAVFLGRTNMDEFALGSSTENSAYGPTRNPHDEARVAGGTSGGSAAAVAARMALGAFGSDTGGSVRNPASYCGVVGLKPSYGAVSRSGLIAAVSSFDQIGPLAHTVEDVEVLFNAVRGRDELDSTSVDAVSSPSRQTKQKIGVPRDMLDQAKEGMDPEVTKRFEETLRRLQDMGFETIDIPAHFMDIALPAYYIINFAEVSTNLARFDGVRYGLSLLGENLLDDYAGTRGTGFGAEARRRIMLGTYVLSAGYYDTYYGKAVTARSQLTSEMDKLFETVDAIATPTMPTSAFPVGEKNDPLSLYLEDIFTVTANLTGHPAISLPMEQREGELPAGVQFTAAKGNEDALFNIGKKLVNEA